MTDIGKVRRRNKRMKELLELYASIPSNKMKIVMPLIENACFMEIELDELQKLIASEGALDEYQNGEKQKGKKISANMQAYNNLLKSYNTVNARLEALLPEEKKAQSKLNAFLGSDE